MDLRAEILNEHSKTQALKIAEWVGNTPSRFAALLNLFLNDEYRVVQRAAWIISMVAKEYPTLLQPHLPAMIARMQKPDLPTAVKRNVVRILQHISIPEALQGPVMNVCFELLANPKEAVAVRAFSMTVLGKLAETYPDLKPELRAIIEDALETQEVTAAFISRAKQTLKQL